MTSQGVVHAGAARRLSSGLAVRSTQRVVHDACSCDMIRVLGGPGGHAARRCLIIDQAFTKRAATFHRRLQGPMDRSRQQRHGHACERCVLTVFAWQPRSHRVSVLARARCMHVPYVQAKCPGQG